MKNFTVVTAMIVLGALTRFLPHPSNFTAIAAIALFGGAKLNNRFAAFIIPLAAMLLSDLIIGFHNTMVAVYVSIAAITLIGMYVSKKESVMSVALGSLTGSVLFFLVTNAAVWYHNVYYPQTLAGLTTSYVMGLPFFSNALLGDLCYNGLFFGSFYLLQQRIPSLVRNK